jgi:hypothetical protein
MSRASSKISSIFFATVLVFLFGAFIASNAFAKNTQAKSTDSSAVGDEAKIQKLFNTATEGHADHPLHELNKQFKEAPILASNPTLTSMELAAIEFYSQENVVYPVNKFLRSGKAEKFSPQSLNAIAKLAVSGLEKFPRGYIAASRKVYRGIKLSEKQTHDFFKVGEEFKDRAFMSTSESALVAKKFADGADKEGKIPIIMEIQSHSGRTVIADGERDVIFLPGTRFMTKAVERSNGVVWVQLDEIASK